MKKNKLFLQLKEIQFSILNESPLVDVETQLNKITKDMNLIDKSNLVPLPPGSLNTNLELKSIQNDSEENILATDSSIPSWVKLNAAWWADGLVPDDEFISGIEYMIKKGILRI